MIAYRIIPSRLYRGINNNNYQVVKDAIADGVNINSFRNRKEVVWDNYSVDNPLLVAIFNNHENIADYLIESGADLNYVCDNGKSLLYYLVEFGCYGYAKKLVDGGADINFKYNGKSILQCAIESNQKEITYMLLNCDNIIITDDELNTALTVIKTKGFFNEYGFLKKILEYNKNIDTQIYDSIYNCKKILNTDIKQENKTIIVDNISSFGTHDVLEYLINKGYVDLEKAYLLACQYNNLDNVKYLLQKGVNIDTSDSSGLMAVEYAVKNQAYDVFNYLISKNVTIKGRKGTNYPDILTFAVQNNDYELTKLLIEKYGAILNDDEALIEALYGKNSALKAFAENKIYKNYRINDGTSMLDYACIFGNAEGVRIILENGADINFERGCPLVDAVVYGNIDCVKLLCDYGVDTQYNITHNGDTASALIYAVKFGQYDMVKILIENGAKFKDQEEFEKAMKYSKYSEKMRDLIIGNNLLDKG